MYIAGTRTSVAFTSSLVPSGFYCRANSFRVSTRVKIGKCTVQLFAIFGVFSVSIPQRLSYETTFPSIDISAFLDFLQFIWPIHVRSSNVCLERVSFHYKCVCAIIKFELVACRLRSTFKTIRRQRLWFGKRIRQRRSRNSAYSRCKMPVWFFFINFFSVS